MKVRENKANLNVGRSKGPGVGGRTEASISEELGAVVPHAGLCAGGGRVTALSTATTARRHCVADWPRNNMEKEVSANKPEVLSHSHSAQYQLWVRVDANRT